MWSERPRARLLLLALALLGSASCAAPGAGEQASSGAGPERLGVGAVAFGRVLSEGESGSKAGHFRHWDAEGNWQVPTQPLWTLAEPLLRCRVQRAEIGADRLGYPAVLVKLIPEDSARLAEFSARLIGQRMAVLVDDAVVFAPTVAEPLRGSFELSGHFSPADAKALLAVLAPGSQQAAAPH